MPQAEAAAGNTAEGAAKVEEHRSRPGKAERERPTSAVTAVGTVPALALAKGATMAALEDVEQLLRTECELATATEAVASSLEEDQFHKAHSEWAAEQAGP